MRRTRTLSESERRFFIGLAAVTRMIRARDDLSQREVARRARVSAAFVSDVESQRANPTATHLDQLAKGLGLAGVHELVSLAEKSATRLAASAIRPAT